MRVLIAFSSGYGTTREVAQEVGRILETDPHLTVEIESIDQVVDLAPYEAVIIGSSVRAQHATANVADFITSHRLDLAKKKFALFLVCLAANNQEGREKVMAQYVPPLLESSPQIHPISIQAFGGKIDFDKLNHVMKRLMRRVLANTGLPTNGSVDTRDWDYIREWAGELKNKLAS
jgi:menaquinone-dependent protoporphyrinogen oxidase